MLNILRTFCFLITLILLNGCNSYQLTSYYDENNDGIYHIRSNSSKYKKIFDNIAYNVNEEDQQSFDDQLPWGDDPDSTEIVYNFFPSYGGYYPYNFGYLNSRNYYRYGRFNFFGNYPYYYNNGPYGFGFPYYSPYNFYLNPYYSYENPYSYRFGLSRYYPWRYYNSNEKEHYGSRNYGGSISKINSRRGERKSSGTKINRDNLATSSNFYNRGSAMPRLSNDSKTNENDRVLSNFRGSEVKTYQSEKNYSRYSNTSRESLRNLNYVPDLNSIKKEQIRNTYKEARSFRGIKNNSPGYNSYRSNNNYNNSNNSRSSSRSYNAPRTFSRSNSSGTSRSSSSSRGSSARGSGKIN
tara:strand:+ start:10403 stop:11461 length:1059 start_codon:yes stop_codon:yes gene_type:complete